MRTLRRLGSFALLGGLTLLGLLPTLLPAFDNESVCAGGDVPPYYAEVCVPPEGINIT